MLTWRMAIPVFVSVTLKEKIVKLQVSSISRLCTCKFSKLHSIHWKVARLALGAMYILLNTHACSYNIIFLLILTLCT